MNPFRSCWTKRAPSGKPSAMPIALRYSQYTTETPANANLDPKSLPCRRRRRKKCRRRGCETWCGHPFCGVSRQQCPKMRGPALLNLWEPCTNWTLQEVFTEVTTCAFGNYFPSMVNCVQVSTFFDILPLLMVKPDFLWKAALIRYRRNGKQK